MVFNTVKDIIVDCMGARLKIDEADISPDTDFVTDLCADSVDIANIISSIEEEYEIEIDNEDVEDIITVGDVVTKIEMIK
ncbi:MAG: acyl carrier protein [Clostridia bacterium]|nr:acyl carrier protein [Clostridia bacterium]